MSKLPTFTAKSLERILLRLGFEAVRQKGSHVFYRHADGRVTTIPHHKSRDLAPPLVRSILTDIRLSPRDLLDFMEGRSHPDARAADEET